MLFLAAILGLVTLALLFSLLAHPETNPREKTLGKHVQIVAKAIQETPLPDGTIPDDLEVKLHAASEILLHAGWIDPRKTRQPLVADLQGLVNDTTRPRVAVVKQLYATSDGLPPRNGEAKALRHAERDLAQLQRAIETIGFHFSRKA